MSFSRESNTVLIKVRNVFVALYVKNGSPGGSIAVIINWPHCGDHEVARLRRSLNGSIAPIINSDLNDVTLGIPAIFSNGDIT